MRILVLSGSHSRHLFVHKKLVEQFDVCGAILMERESEVPQPPASTSVSDVANWNRHFQERNRVERFAFGNLSADDVFRDIELLRVSPAELNSKATAEFVARIQPDIVFIFGVDLIKEPLFSILPDEKINMHLGLSPWYRGSATLFWPFYDLRPQYAGATFHYIVPEADAGAIIHQSVPELVRGDGIHDVGSKTVLKAVDDLVGLMNLRLLSGRFEVKDQKSSGRLFLTADFRPEHLRVIYELYDNDLVDQYLDGNLGKRTPKLISGI